MGKNRLMIADKVERAENSLYHTIRDHENVELLASQVVGNRPERIKQRDFGHGR
jgi:hypothetical protein